MNLKLEPYQQEAVDFLYNRERAALFASMGLGKSAATLCALNQLFQDGAIRAALIVAPLRVARLTWPNEIAKWDQFKWMKVEVINHKKPSGKADIYTINYEKLHKLPNLDFCDVVVFDELTKAKNPQSTRINAVRPLLKHHRRWGLTGTPRPNSLLEVFAQIRLLDDGKRLSSSFTHFRNTYFHATDYMEYNWEPNEGSEDAIYRKIEDLTLTQRAQDYSDVPDTILEDIETVLNPEARRQYLALEKDLLTTIEDDVLVATNAAVLSNKLLQFTGGTVYTEQRNIVMVDHSKIEALTSIIGKIGREPILIACNYRHERARIVKYTGAVDASTYEGDIEKAWNSRKIPLLVADPRSLGHGLNLQEGGRTIVWFSPTWSRELYDQFNARLARKGQDKRPRIYRIIAKDTIDEAVIETLRLRGDSQSAMLQTLINLKKLRSA